MTGRRALGGLALALGLGLGLGLAPGCRGGAADEGGLAEPIDVAAATDRLDDRGDDKPGFLAALTPKQAADIMAPYTSAGASLAVKLGDTVTAGQVVARLDDRQLRQELDAGRAQLRTAQAAVVQAEVDRRGAEIVLTREKAAEAAGVGSRADLATAIQAVDKAAAAVTVARATAEERATRLAQLQAHLSEMTLVSPIAGSVALMYAQDGARVEEGRPVLRVISGGVYVKFAIPADKAGSVRPGDLVDLRLDRRPDLLTARVGHVAPELDAVAQMVIADADLVDPPPDLQPGTVGRILPRTAHPAATRPTK
jgi:multidrug efflux pump subunit AcrA (membrane-fusion protein)